MRWDVMACYVISCHVISCHVISCHVMSCHVMSCHVMSCHVMSYRVLLCHVVSSLISSCRNAPLHAGTHVRLDQPSDLSASFTALPDVTSTETLPVTGFTRQRSLPLDVIHAQEQHTDTDVREQTTSTSSSTSTPHDSLRRLNASRSYVRITSDHDDVHNSGVVTSSYVGLAWYKMRDIQRATMEWWGVALVLCMWSVFQLLATPIRASRRVHTWIRTHLPRRAVPSSHVSSPSPPLPVAQTHAHDRHVAYGTSYDRVKSRDAHASLPISLSPAA